MPLPDVGRSVATRNRGFMTTLAVNLRHLELDIYLFSLRATLAECGAYRYPGCSADSCRPYPTIVRHSPLGEARCDLRRGFDAPGETESKPSIFPPRTLIKSISYDSADIHVFFTLPETSLSRQLRIKVPCGDGGGSQFRSFVPIERKPRRKNMFAKWVYRGLPTALLLAIAAFVQFYAIKAFV